MTGLQIERAKREVQLKTAQLTTLAQREELVRVKLFGALSEYSDRTGLNRPQDPSNVHDIVAYAEDVVRHASESAAHRAQVRRASPRRQFGGVAQADHLGGGYDFVSSALSGGLSEHNRAVASAWISPEKANNTAHGGSHSGDKRRSDRGANQSSRYVSQFRGENSDFLDHGHVADQPQQYGFRSGHGPAKRNASPAAKKSAAAQRSSPPGVTRSSPEPSDSRRNSRVDGRDSSRARSHSESSPLSRAAGGDRALNPLQERLRRARLAFNSLKEPLL